MDRFTVAFFGHKHIDVTSKIEKALDENVQRILAQKEHVNFLFGRDSDFDLLAASSVRRVRKQYREDNSSLTLIIPEITPEYLEGVDTPENYYSEIEVCLAAAVALPKYMMQVRNHEMIDRADLVLCYVTHESPVAWRCVQYAHYQGKMVINLADVEGSNSGK